MELFILTHKRYHKQVTWNSLSEELKQSAKLVVVHGEASKYDKKYPIIETPEGLKGVSNTRQWILDNATENKIVMLDDDLTFARRRKDMPDRFEPILPVELSTTFSRIDRLLDTYAHGTILAREGGNRVPPGVKYVGRAMRVLCFNRKFVKELDIKFTPGLVQDDFDITLQLLKKGERNFIFCDTVQNQSGGSGAAGGASDYRDMEYHNGSVKYLAQLHPGLVTVVEKHTKVAWGGQPRLDVIVQWKKAYEQGVRDAAV